MANVNEGPVVEASHGGYVTVWKEVDGVFGWYAYPLAKFFAIRLLAEGAVKPSDLGSAATTADVSSFVSAEDFAAQMADLAAQNLQLQQLLTTLYGVIGADSIVVFEPGVFEPGVFVPVRCSAPDWHCWSSPSSPDRRARRTSSIPSDQTPGARTPCCCSRRNRSARTNCARPSPIS